MQTLTTIEVSRLTECEQAIERGLTTFVEVGNALMEIRDSRLYRTAHGTFEDYCQAKWGWGKNYANKLILAADIVTGLGTLVPILPKTETQARELVGVEPEKRAEVWQAVIDSAPEGKVTAQYVRETVKAFQAFSNGMCQCPTCKNLYDGVKFTSCPYCTVAPAVVVSHVEVPPQHFRTQFTGENEWYTPNEHLDAVRGFLGGIDLDPASSDKAQEKVKAKRYFTIEDDGLTKKWTGRVWLNPPYAQPFIAQFVEKLVDEVNAGNVSEAILLTHNYTDTSWFHLAESACAAICFTRGRIKFYNGNGEVAAPTQGQAFFYYGPNVDGFKKAFKGFGFIR